MKQGQFVTNYAVNETLRSCEEIQAPGTAEDRYVVGNGFEKTAEHKYINNTPTTTSPPPPPHLLILRYACAQLTADQKYGFLFCLSLFLSTMNVLKFF